MRNQLRALPCALALAFSAAAHEPAATKPTERAPVLVLLPTTTFEGMRPLLDELGKLGLEPRHVFPPGAVIAERAASKALDRSAFPKSWVLLEGPIEPGARWASVELRPEIEMIWNANYHGQAARYGLEPSERPGSALVDDAFVPPPSAETGHAQRLVDPGNPFGAADDNTSEFLFGKVAIAIFTVESAGNGENWSPARIAQVKAEIQNGMNAWATDNPQSTLTFYYQIIDQCPTSVEPIVMNSFDAQDQFIPQCLSSVGFPATSANYFGVTRAYDRAIRNQFGAHWGVSMFVVDSLADPDGMFSNAPYFAYSYYGGPLLVMTYDNDGWGIGQMDLVALHEASHSFWAFDEYSTSNCLCSSAQGYLNAQNQNCENGACALNVGCAMRGDATFSECVYTRNQMGINDSDGDGKPDVRDTFPNAVLDAFPSSTADATPTLTGTAVEVPLTNQNSQFYTTRSNISLNTIIGVEYRIDGREWVSTTAADGQFNGPQEAFTLTTHPVPPGTHTIEARARNSTPNFELAPFAARTFSVTSLDLAHDTCDGAQVVPPNGPFPYMTAVTPDITNATSTDDPPFPGCQSNTSRSIWYKFVPLLSGTYEISSCASAPTGTTVVDTVIGVVTSPDGQCSNFSQVSQGCDDNSCQVLHSQAIVKTALTAGTTYYIVAYKRGSSPPSEDETAVQLRITRFLPPANDECAAAEVIPPAGPFPHLTSLIADITYGTSTNDPPAPACSAATSRSVWYRFTPASPGSYTFSTCAGAPTGTTVNDTVIDIVTSAGGACGGFSAVGSGCDDNGCFDEASQATVTVDLAAGTTYFAVVYQRGSGTPPPGDNAVQLRVTKNLALANDNCAQAETIPGSGPFPYWTGVTADISAATSTGDPALPACSSSVSRSIWYRIVPDATGSYTFSSCADAPTGTTVDDTIIDVVSSADGSCSPLSAVPGGCDDEGCAVEAHQAVVTVDLTAGTTYFVLVYKKDTSPPNAGNTAVQLFVDRQVPPANELCSNAAVLSLGIPVSGSTALGTDEYRTPTTSQCYSGVGQSAADARGPEVVFTFTAPTAGGYAFRVRDTAQGSDPILYLSGSCPLGSPPQTVDCLAAANRSNGDSAEEVSCVSLANGETVYVFVDDRNTGFDGGDFVIEVENCSREAEPNDTPATASPLACGIRGASSLGSPDFFVIPPTIAGSRFFAMADGSALETTSDLDARATTLADTLEYDDDNNVAAYGEQSANLGGTPLPAGPVFWRIDDSRTEEPYRLFSIVQPPQAFATPEAEPNDTIADVGGGMSDYYAGTLVGPSPSTDVDILAVPAVAGDLIHLGLDADPLRDETPIGAALALLDASGTVVAAADDNEISSDNSTTFGNLAATRPRSPAEAIAYRVASTGTYFARVAISPGTNQAAGSGDYLLSIARNCVSTAWADLSLAATDVADPVIAGEGVTYSITVANAGPGTASGLQLSVPTPANTTFQAMMEPSGWGCTAPAQGATGNVICTTASLDPGANAVLSLALSIDVCADDGSIVTAIGTVFAATADPDAADLTASEPTTISAAPDTDGDGTNDTCDSNDDGDALPDATDCAPLSAGAFSVPSEVVGFVFTNKTTLSWSSAAPSSGSATVHDVPRGMLGQLPVGTGAAETCLVPGGTPASSAIDASTPASGTGRWYLVRGRNLCGAGGYGQAGVEPRATAVCP